MEAKRTNPPPCGITLPSTSPSSPPVGLFVDAFDLFLFNVYRIPSLKELGLSGVELTRAGEKLLSIQMAGMMLGGILTGMIANRRGRVTALFRIHRAVLAGQHRQRLGAGCGQLRAGAVPRGRRTRG